MLLWGLIFEKILRQSYEKLMKKSDLRKTQDEPVIITKSYKNLIKHLGRSSAKLMKNLQKFTKF